jgi:2-C-methyl-D-erythritol 4-phosphate cytidylyltransferase
MKCQAIILAGGEGNRFGGGIAKQFIKLAGKTIVEHTIDRFERNPLVDSVIVVVNPEYYDYMNEILLKNGYRKLRKLIKGGKTRQESSYAGLCACDDDTQKVLLHDAVRPLISDRVIKDAIEALDSYDAVDVAIPAADTIIKVNDDRIIESIPERRYLMRGQTPQGFKLDFIKKAYELFMQDQNVSFTDDCGLILHYQLGDIFVVSGEEKNLKITYAEDAYLADKLFQINSLQLLDRPGRDVADELAGKVGVVFGYSSGIGKEVYDLVRSRGGKIHGFSRENGVDIARYDQVEEALRQVSQAEGRIDYIVNTAGILRIAKLEATPQEEIHHQVAANYLGSVNVTKAAIPYLRESRGSVVLFTSSSYTRGRGMYSIYSSTKAAIVNFVQAVSEEVYADGIRINVINPERTGTPMRFKNFGYEPPETLLSAEKVAQATLEVVLSEITGQVIDVRRD